MQVINFLFVQQQGNQIITGTLSISKYPAGEIAFLLFSPRGQAIYLKQPLSGSKTSVFLLVTSNLHSLHEDLLDKV